MRWQRVASLNSVKTLVLDLVCVTHRKAIAHGGRCVGRKKFCAENVCYCGCSTVGAHSNLWSSHTPGKGASWSLGSSHECNCCKLVSQILVIKQVLVFGQGAHLDWDWLNVFTTNVNNTPPDYLGWYWEIEGASWSARRPSNDIFTRATEYMTNNEFYG